MFVAEPMLMPSVLAHGNFIPIKYNASGTEQWVRTYAGAASAEDRAIKIRVSNAGDVYVVGREWNGTDFDITIVTYSATGTPGWTYTYPDAGGDELPADAVIDAAGNLFVTATATSPFQKHTYICCKCFGQFIMEQHIGCKRV